MIWVYFFLACWFHQKKILFQSHTLWGREIGISLDDKWPATPPEKWTILGTPQKKGPYLKKEKIVCINRSIFADVFAFSVSFAYCLRGEHVSCCVSILCDAIIHMSKQEILHRKSKSNDQSTTESPKHSPIEKMSMSTKSTFLFHKISFLEKVVQTSITIPY